MVGKRDRGIVEITADDHRVRRLLHVLLDCYGLLGPDFDLPRTRREDIFLTPSVACWVFPAGQFFIDLLFILA